MGQIANMAATSFDTSFGRCAIVWEAGVITGFSLPPTHCGSQRPPPWVTRVHLARATPSCRRDAGFCRPAIFLGYGVRFSATGVSSSIVGQTGTDGELRPACRLRRTSFDVKGSRSRLGTKSLATPHPMPSFHWGRRADDRVLLTWRNQDEVASPCARGRAVVRRMSAARAKQR